MLRKIFGVLLPILLVFISLKTFGDFNSSMPLGWPNNNTLLEGDDLSDNSLDDSFDDSPRVSPGGSLSGSLSVSPNDSFNEPATAAPAAATETPTAPPLLPPTSNGPPYALPNTSNFNYDANLNELAPQGDSLAHSSETTSNTPVVPPAPAAPTYTPKPAYKAPPQPPPRPSTFKAPPANTQLLPAVASSAHLYGGDRAVAIDGCGKNLTIGPKRHSCGPLTLSKDFYSFLMKQLPVCVNQALKSEGLPSATDINLHQIGEFSKRMSTGGRSQMSLHSAGRALDVADFTLKLSNGRTLFMPMDNTNPYRPFFKTFVSCWSSAVSNAQPSCHYRHQAGAITCIERPHDHHDHTHISLPYCPGKPGIAGT